MRNTPLRALVLSSIVLTSAALPVRGAAADVAPGDATVVPVQVTGDPDERFNLVVLGDGYTEADMPTFRADVDKHLNVLWSIEPFKSYRSYVNVYRVEIASGESGVSCDPDLTSPRRNTPLKMAFWGGCQAQGPQRLLTLDQAAAARYADMVAGTTPSNRQILALGNSRTYGGAGGAYATASGGNAMSALISPHELGHSLGGLQDEYDYYQRGEPGGRYTGGEPDSVHHTLLTERQMRERRAKWWRWLGERSEAGGRIGRYEGGLYHSTGVWRPSRHSIMKSLGYYFDQVGRERMTQAISQKVSLLQDAAPADRPVGADRVLWVETMHPVGHALSVTWTVDGRTVQRGGHDLDLRRLRLRPGRHAVTVTVSDPTPFIRDPQVRDSLTRTRTWTVDTALTTPPDATPDGLTDTTPTNVPVGARSVIYAETTHPATRPVRVHWTIDGRPVQADRDLDLKRFRLRPGTHRVTATAGNTTRTWTVDATPPVTSYEVSRPAEQKGEHYTFDERFTLRLTPKDDQNGYVVSEFRVDGDGWYHYYGWPTDSNAPFLFTPDGTVIDHLVYGKLPRGRHTIEYRSIDAAGNYGTAKRFTVTLR
ncbi:peptidase [Actinomadura rubrobrunea]|uniref:Peptidase n=1 Tax=Actinomadura rubrobrunea TaxID=115335 RepID=A0A9W6UZQ8_9ACTN|nr:M64 family metallopeptidase [Actinomadura rubrobrunea]GLW67487.1 peptidase [Actinomadura rubrobrunea]